MSRETIMVREPDVTIATLLKLCGSVVAPTQYSCLENPMDGGAWWAAVHGAAKSKSIVHKGPVKTTKKC